MKRVIALASVSLTLLFAGGRTAHATEVGGPRRFGLGIAFGDPTGFVGKLFLNSTNALDFGVSFGDYGGCYDRRGSYNCNGEGRLNVNVDYLWQAPLARGQVHLDWHIGVGGRMRTFSHSDTAALGVRMPLGLDLTFDNPRFLEVFFEFSPIFYVNPHGWLNIEPLLGVRFYF